MRSASRWAVILSMFAATLACDRIVTATADASGGDDDTCGNPLYPSGEFRIIYSRTGSSVDTTTPQLNRYLVPHRWADTVNTTLDDGVTGLHIVIGYGSSEYCMTLYDSLMNHLPNAAGAVIEP